MTIYMKPIYACYSQTIIGNNGSPVYIYARISHKSQRWHRFLEWMRDNIRTLNKGVNINNIPEDFRDLIPIYSSETYNLMERMLTYAEQIDGNSFNDKIRLDDVKKQMLKMPWWENSDLKERGFYIIISLPLGKKTKKRHIPGLELISKKAGYGTEAITGMPIIPFIKGKGKRVWKANPDFEELELSDNRKYVNSGVSRCEFVARKALSGQHLLGVHPETLRRLVVEEGKLLDKTVKMLPESTQGQIPPNDLKKLNQVEQHLKILNIPMTEKEIEDSIYQLWTKLGPKGEKKFTNLRDLSIHLGKEECYAKKILRTRKLRKDLGHEPDEIPDDFLDQKVEIKTKTGFVIKGHKIVKAVKVVNGRRKVLLDNGKTVDYSRIVQIHRCKAET